MGILNGYTLLLENIKITETIKIIKMLLAVTISKLLKYLKMQLHSEKWDMVIIWIFFIAMQLS